MIGALTPRTLPTPTRIPALIWVDATGTTRRVRAMAYMGHTFATIARHVGLKVEHIEHIAAGRQSFVPPRVADRVRDAARELCWRIIDNPTPEQDATRRYAQAQRWHSIIVWDDVDDPAAKPVVEADTERNADGTKVKSQVVDAASVHLAMSGHPPRQLTQLDRRIAVALLTTHKKMSGPRIADAMGINLRLVMRDRRHVRENPSVLGTPVAAPWFLSGLHEQVKDDHTLVPV